MAGPLRILGASARAAALSAARAGWEPLPYDLFADRDLSSRFPVVRVPAEDYPDGLLTLLENAPPAPWIYTGGLENSPELIDTLAQRHPLLGNPGKVLRGIRDPFRVETVLRNAQIPCPRIWREPAPPPTDGTWMVKPLQGAGGTGVRRWLPGELPPRRPHVFQEVRPGIPCAGLFLVGSHETQLVGVTVQLVGERWLHARPFAYCGSIGPLSLNQAETSAFQRLGDALSQSFGLIGVFGVDVLLHEGVPWPVEVNPRYTASVEVLEQTLGLAVFAEGKVVSKPSSPYLGKAILFAPQALSFPDGRPEPDWADIPHPGELIPAGHPVLTLFARGTSRDSVLSQLRSRVDDLDQRLFGR